MLGEVSMTTLWKSRAQPSLLYGKTTQQVKSKPTAEQIQLPEKTLYSLAKETVSKKTTP